MNIGVMSVLILFRQNIKSVSATVTMLHLFRFKIVNCENQLYCASSPCRIYYCYYYFFTQ